MLSSAGVRILLSNRPSRRKGKIKVGFSLRKHHHEYTVSHFLYRLTVQLIYFNVLLLSLISFKTCSGRVFYQCGKLKAFQCKFWKWEDDIPKKRATEMSANKNVDKSATTSEDIELMTNKVPEATVEKEAEDDEKKQHDDVVKCKCDEMAVKQVVKKEGKNKGRIFFHCGNRGKRCSFWRWGTKQEQQKEEQLEMAKNGSKKEQQEEEKEKEHDEKEGKMSSEDENEKKEFKDDLKEIKEGKKSKTESLDGIERTHGKRRKEDESKKTEKEEKKERGKKRGSLRDENTSKPKHPRPSV